MKSMTQTDDVRQERRRVRLAAQAMLWRESAHKSVRHCGRSLVHGGEGAQLRVSAVAGGRRAGIAGLQACGSVWSCPVCSARILGHRQGEIAAAVDFWRKTGGQVAGMAFTISHKRADSIDDVWDAVMSAWAAVTSGAASVAERARWGVGRSGGYCTAKSCISAARRRGEDLGRFFVDCPVQCCGDLETTRGKRHALRNCGDGGLTKSATAHLAAGTCDDGVVVDGLIPWVRVVEVTHGGNGWHVHMHVLAFVPPTMTPVLLEDWYHSMWTRWARGAAAAGFDGSRQVNRASFFTDESSAALGDYLTKNTYSAGDRAGLETMRGDLKSGRFGNRAPFEILRDLVLQPDGSDPERDAALWKTYELASLGRRQMAWAEGSRSLLGLDEVEKTEEEIVAVEEGSELDALCDVDAAGLRAIVGTRGRRHELLVAAESSDVEAFALLRSWGFVDADPFYDAGGFGRLVIYPPGALFRSSSDAG